MHVERGRVGKTAVLLSMRDVANAWCMARASCREAYVWTAVAPVTHVTVAGHVPAIMGAKGPWSFIKWHQTYGKIYKLSFLDEHVVVLSDPTTITSITRKAGK
jgi:hypothetical protein